MTDGPRVELGGWRRELRPGSELGPYRIERELGRGGVAIVYAARHLILDRPVALKLLLESHAGDRESVQRFLREARAAARLDHPHIVPIHDCGEIEGVNFIAMKLLDGRDLRTLLQEERQEGRGRLPLERAVNIMGQAADALVYAHAHGVVHRDVKPANIYVDDDDHVTLVDFGIASALDLAAVTIAGTVIGTPLYMSPEQAVGSHGDERSDLYSLGVVLYEMLAGSPPFSGRQQTVMFAHVHTPPPPLATSRPDIPAGVNEAVERVLAKDPDQRFQSAAVFAATLRAAAGPGSGSINEDATVIAAVAVADTDGFQVRPFAIPVAAGPAPASKAPTRFAGAGPAVLLGSGAVALALGWALVAGPLTKGAGRLTVASNPAGASVMVDGNLEGVTPLAAQTLSTGTHQIVLTAPTYQQVTRREQIRRGETNTVNVTLPPAPAFDLLQVEDAAVVDGFTRDADQHIHPGNPIGSVSAGQSFDVVFGFAQKDPGYRDLNFYCQIEVDDPSGRRVLASDPREIKIDSSDADEHSCNVGVTLPASANAGTYGLRFLINGKDAQLIKDGRDVMPHQLTVSN